MMNDQLTDNRDPGDESDAADRAQAFNPWQLGMTPPPGVRFEMPEGGGGAGGDLGAEGGGGTAVVDPPLEAAADPALGAEPVADDRYTADELAAMMRTEAGSAFRELLAEAERRDQQAAAERQAAAQRAQGSQLPEWDPFDPAVVNAHVEHAARQMIQPLIDAMQPALETSEQFRLEQGRTQALEVLDGFTELGEFDRDRTILQAARYVAQGIDPEQALSQAATEQAGWEREVEQRAVAAFRTNAQNLANAGVEPGGMGAAAEAAEPLSRAGQRRDYKAEARGSLARMGRLPGVGEPTG